MLSPAAASPPSNGHTLSNTFQIDSSAVFVEFLIHIIEAALGAKRKDLENDGSLLSIHRYPDTVQRCSRFANESQVALYVQKVIAVDDGINGDVDASGNAILT